MSAATAGEVALRVCKRYLAANVTGLDLPLVCEIGRNHIAREVEADRIAFLPGDARRDAFPAEQDLIMFKSFLHEWGEQDAVRFLAKAFQALPKGGGVSHLRAGPNSGRR